jgi:hypothetical protein
MSGVSNYFLDLVADNISNRVEFPSTVYVGLVTAEPFTYSTGSTIVEPPSGVGYGRQAYVMNSSNWSVASGGQIRSTQPITFSTQVTGIWGTVVAWVLCTADVGGSVLAWGTLDEQIYVNTGAYVSLPAGSLMIAVEHPSSGVLG